VSDKLNQAIKYIKAGDKEYGKHLLIEVLNAEPENAQAWLWMSAVVDTDELRRECLEKVLEYNPRNQAAKKGLEQLRREAAPPAAQARPAPPLEKLKPTVPPVARQPVAQAAHAPPEQPVEVSQPRLIPALGFEFKIMRKGQAQGLRFQKGKATGQQLVLGEQTLDYGAIGDTTTRENYLFMEIAPGTQLDRKFSEALNDNVLSVVVHKTEALELERYIDRRCSDLQVENNRQRLFQAGRGDLFRTVTCPECQALIDLSELDKTPYMYCRFCESIFTEERVASRGNVYRICQDCHMFDRIKDYNEFYFYFLVVAYGYSSKTRYVCDNCAHSMFKKMLLLNLIFILGVPAAIYVKIKSLRGRAPHLKKLAEANALARKGDYQKAAPIYDLLYKKIPEHPGLLTNQGLGHLAAGDEGGALAHFQRAQKACSSYMPALWWINRLTSTPDQARFDPGDFEV
jgi:hypothetical protein